MPIYEDDIDTLPTAARNGISLPPSSSELIRYARTDAAKIGIDPDIAERRIRQESGGNSRAVSDKGAFGAAQLMPATARELAGRYGGNPEDPFDNVRLGNRYYKEQYDRYGNDTLAAAAYNAGPGAVDKYGGVPPYRETQDYVSKVARGGVRTGPLPTAASVSGARQVRDEFEGLVDAEPTQMDGVAESTQMKGAAESSATARGALGAAWDFAKDSVLSTLHLEDGRSDSTGGDWGRALGGQGVGVAIPQTALGVNRWAIGTPSNAIASALVPQVMMDWRDSINDRFSAWLNKRSADLQAQKTPTMQESAKKQYFESSWKDVSENGLSGVPGEVIQRAKDGRLFGSGWSDWRKISDSALQSLPVSLVSMIPATRAAGTAYKGAYAGAINSGATEEAAKAIAVKAAERTAGYMGGAMEGITGAGSQYEQTYQQVMDLPQSKLESSASYEQALKLQPADLAPQERAMRARRTIAHAASSTAAIVAGISDALLGGLGDRYLGSAAAGKDSRLRSVLRGLGQETPTEFGQSGLEQFGTNLGVKSFADPSQSLSDQVGEQAVGGALSGGLMGGGMGGASYHKQGTPAEAQSSGAESPPAVGGAVPASDFLGRPPNPPTSLQPAPAPVSAPVDAAAAAIEADPTPVAPSRTLTLTTGAPTTFSTETGVMLEGNYALAEADDLIASHDTNLRPNPAFPVELQPRSRDRAASGLQISQIVQKLNPERLGASPDVANGAPIIGADGLVESGNARTIALRRTYEANGLQAQRYRDWLKASAEQFGITPDAVDAMQKPILVRVRNTPVNRAEFARQANTSTVAAMSATEQAASDVARIGYLDDLQLTEDGDLTGADNRSFVNRFVGGLSPGEQAGMLDAAGRLSQAGVTRIRNAVMARAYGNSPTLMRMVESADANLRNLTNALTRVAPKVAKAREAIAAGALHDADLTSDLLAAVEALVKIKEDGRSVDESLAQMELGGQSLSDETRDLIRFLDQNSRAPRRVAAFISDYFDALASFGNPQQQSLLDDGTIPDMRSLIAQVKERTNATETNPSASGAAAQPGATPEPQPGSTPSGTQGTAEGTPGALTGSGTYRDGGKWSATYRVIARRDGSFGLERDFTDDDGTRTEFLRDDGQWVRGRASTVGFGSNVGSLSDGPETFQTRADAEEAARTETADMGGAMSAAPASEWVAFPPDSGTLGIPRAEMPQVKSADRAALVQFLKARGIDYEKVSVDPHTLRPTQSEFSLKKTAKSSEVRADTDRSILISSDGYVLDGHHQWVWALSNGEQEDAIRFNAPIRELIAAVFEFPSVKQSDGGANVIDMASVRQAREAKADQDYEAALADLGTWVRGNLTGTFRMVPEATPALLKTLTRLFDAAIRKGYYTFSKAVTRVMADLRRSKETAPLVNSVKPQMLQQAYDDALKAYTSERGPDGPQTELFADQKQGETADMFAAPTAKAAERTPTAVTAVPFFMDWIKTQGDTWPVHGERLEKLRDLYAATYPQQITRENGPPIVKKDVAKDEMAPDLPPAAGIVNKIDLSATPEQKVAALVDLAKQNEPIVAAFIAKVDAKYGTASKYSFKEPEKILSKPVRPSILAAKPWYGVEHIRDSFRFKTVLQRYSDLPAIVQTLRTELGAEIVEQDTRKVLAPKEWGWRIVAFDLRMPNGQIIEYDLPIAEQEAYKKAEGHKLFEDWRNKDVNNLTDDEKRQFQAALLMSNEGYQSAWEASIARTGQDEAAIRAFLTQLSASAPSTRLNSSLSSSAENNLPDQTAPSNEPKTPASASSTITRPSSDLDTTGFISTPSAASIDQVGTDKKGVGNENATNGSSGDEGPGSGPASTNGAGGNAAGVRRGSSGSDRQPLDPVMSRGGQGDGVDLAEVRALVQAVRAGLGNAARIEVAATPDELPPNLLAHVRKNNAMADVHAILDPQTQIIHLVAGNLGSMGEAEAAIFHDLFGHYGLRGIIGDAYTRTMRQIAAHNANVRREASAIRSRYGYGELLAIEEALAERAGAGETVRMIDRVMAALSAGLRRIGLTRMADLIERMTDAEVRVLLGRAREFVRGGNRNANNLVPEMQMAMSRAGQAPANASPQQRADAFLAQQSRRIAPIEAVLSAPFKLTRLDRVLAGASDRLLQALGHLVPETVKQGLVADYKNPQAVVDRRQSMRGAQSRLLRESGDLLNRLATLTRAESRVAYEWMNSQDPQSAEWFRQQLPEESVRVLADIEKLIDRLSKEAVALGQLNPEAFARNRFAYLRRSYVKHTAELDQQEAKARSRAIAVFGEQYKGRGMFEAVPMAKIENIAPAWWKRKLQTGKADTALKGEKFIRLEHRKTVGVGVAPLPGVGPAQQSRLLEVKYFPAGEALPTQYLTWDQAGTWEVRDVKGEDAILWRDFSKEERERMGEIDEVRFAVAKTLHGMIHDVEAGKFLKWIAENHAKKTEADLPQGAIVEQAAESMLRALNPDAWVQVPDSEIPKSGGVKRYGVLGGRFVPVPVWNDIRQSTGRQRPIGGPLWGAILSAWKVSKTGLSPAVHMNNVASNMVMADWADVGVLDLTEALSVISKSGKDPAMREVLNRFEDAGGKGGTFAVTELQREQLEPLLEALRKEYGTAGQATGMVGINAALGLLFKRQWKAALEAASTSMPARGARAAANAMIDLYQSEDVVFRLAKWIKEKRSGATDEQAAKAARSSFLDYEINAPWIQAMRQSAFPFISFTYRAAPMLLNIVTHKPWKILKLGLAYGVLNAIGYALSGGDEDKERKLLPEEKAGRLWGVGPPKLVRMGWNDKHDQPVFLDVRRWVPVGDIVDLGQTHGAVPIVPFLVPSGPLALLGELVANKSQFTGKEIVKKDTDTAGEIAAKTLDHIYKSFAPNLPVLPFTYATESLMNAGGGKTDPFGRELSLPQAAASSVGVKLASYPPDVMARQLAGKRIAALRQIEENVAELTRDYVRKGIDTEEYQDKLARQREKARNVDEEYFKRVR